jgi:hypothetical protein
MEKRSSLTNTDSTHTPELEMFRSIISTCRANGLLESIQQRARIVQAQTVEGSTIKDLIFLGICRVAWRYHDDPESHKSIEESMTLYRKSDKVSSDQLRMDREALTTECTLTPRRTSRRTRSIVYRAATTVLQWKHADADTLTPPCTPAMYKTLPLDADTLPRDIQDPTSRCT